jgi:hypothetical protein
VDEEELSATATFIFRDGVCFPVVIIKHMLNHWSGGPGENAGCRPEALINPRESCAIRAAGAQKKFRV